MKNIQKNYVVWWEMRRYVLKSWRSDWRDKPRASVLRWSGRRQWRERLRVWRAGHAGRCRRTGRACSWASQVPVIRHSGIHGCQRHVTAGGWTSLLRPTRPRLGSTTRTASASPSCTNRHKTTRILRIVKGKATTQKMWIQNPERNVDYVLNSFVYIITTLRVLIDVFLYLF